MCQTEEHGPWQAEPSPGSFQGEQEAVVSYFGSCVLGGVFWKFREERKGTQSGYSPRAGQTTSGLGWEGPDGREITVAACERREEQRVWLVHLLLNP